MRSSWNLFSPTFTMPEAIKNKGKATKKKDEIKVVADHTDKATKKKERRSS